jgi:uncharacterized protein YjbJ (UPF0337 family)
MEGARQSARQLRSGTGVEAQSRPITGRRENIMKSSTKDKTEGKLHEVKGEIKKEVGKAMNDADLKVTGEAEKKAGKVQKWIGRAEKAVGE